MCASVSSVNRCAHSPIRQRLTGDRTWRIIPVTDNNTDSSKNPEPSGNGESTATADPPAYSSAKDSAPCSSNSPPNLSIQGHTSKISTASFSPDGKYIVSTSSNIRVWDAQTGNSVLGPLALDSEASAIAFSSNGRQIAAGLSDGTVLVLDAVTGEMIVGPLKCHAETHIQCINFSPDGRKVASGSYYGKVRIWDAQKGKTILGPLEYKSPHAVAFSGDGELIAIGHYNLLSILDATSGELKWKVGVNQGYTAFVSFSPSAQTVIQGQLGPIVSAWKVDTGGKDAEGSLAVNFTPCNGKVAVSPNGKWIAYADSSKVRVWYSKPWHPFATYEVLTGYVHAVVFSPDSKRLLTADDKIIQVYTLD